MKILYFTKYSRLGASSRMRSYLYFPYLEDQGFHITVKPLFEDEYLKQLYEGKKPLLIIIKSYLKRLALLFTVFRYDKLVIEKELFPYFPSVFEFILSKMGVKYVVDYDDAIFHNYDQSRSPVLKLLKNKIKHVMRYSATVTAGNSYLADYAIKAGASQVKVIPTVIDVNKYEVKEDTDNKANIVIGWIGSPTTLKYLKTLAPVFKQICARYAVKLHIVGGKAGIGLGNDEKIIDWTEYSEASLIKDFDIGVMPLQDSAWEKGKCGYKLIQYMGCGLPVVASPVGVNVDIVLNGKSGYLAATHQEWVAAFEKYLTDMHLRKEHGKLGRSIVERDYNLEVTALKLGSILSL